MGGHWLASGQAGLPALAGAVDEEPVVVDADDVAADLVVAVALELVLRLRLGLALRVRLCLVGLLLLLLLRLGLLAGELRGRQLARLVGRHLLRLDATRLASRQRTGGRPRGLAAALGQTAAGRLLVGQEALLEQLGRLLLLAGRDSRGRVEVGPLGRAGPAGLVLLVAQVAPPALQPHGRRLQLQTPDQLLQAKVRVLSERLDGERLDVVVVQLLLLLLLLGRDLRPGGPRLLPRPRVAALRVWARLRQPVGSVRARLAHARLRARRTPSLLPRGRGRRVEQAGRLRGQQVVQVQVVGAERVDHLHGVLRGAHARRGGAGGRHLVLLLEGRLRLGVAHHAHGRGSLNMRAQLGSGRLVLLLVGGVLLARRHAQRAAGRQLVLAGHQLFEASTSGRLLLLLLLERRRLSSVGWAAKNGVWVVDFGHQKADPAGRLVAQTVGELAALLEAGAALDGLGEVALVGDLHHVLPGALVVARKGGRDVLLHRGTGCGRLLVGSGSSGPLLLLLLEGGQRGGRVH